VSVERAAWGVHEVINEDVAKAFRVHASERGVDYRRCSMIVFGGSGPVHGVRVARKLRIPRVVCPSGAGVMSAFGLLASPVGFELVQSLRVPLAALTGERFAQITGDLESRVRAQLASAGVDLALSHTLLRLDMRYEGQGYEVEVRLPPLAPAQAVAELPTRFADAYAAIFGMSFADRAIEIIAWKCEVQGPVPGAADAYRLRTTARAASALRGQRPVYMPETGAFAQCPVYDRYGLAAGATIAGPALIEEAESTCVLATGDTATIDAELNLIIEIGGARP
jgi:N-methylhydantoinase A